MAENVANLRNQRILIENEIAAPPQDNLGATAAGLSSSIICAWLRGCTKLVLRWCSQGLSYFSQFLFKGPSSRG
ncbi:unnamed protein product [Linum tenue]|uniref:Uncharacterized protein n=1 Tax=Linum tenue TaxID=586396 RepID=A0AAV0HW03_9ROSI|nr:unnamed protein product [Linum tenue]